MPQPAQSNSSNTEPSEALFNALVPTGGSRCRERCPYLQAMSSDYHKLADSLPGAVRASLTMLAIQSKAWMRAASASAAPSSPLIAVFVDADREKRAAAAAVVARHLQTPVNRVALGTLFSRDVRETEQAVERLFDAAQHAAMLLLFDEEDTLAERAESGNDEHPYNEANMKVLLERLQRFGGPAIVAASHRNNVDARLLALAHAVIDLGGQSPLP